MKRVLMVVAIGFFLSTLAVSVFAAGGKNHGELGQGAVEQHQVVNTDNGSPSF